VSWKVAKTREAKTQLPTRIQLEIINEDDEKLKALRNERGDDVYKAVANALLEMNNYNSSGMYAVPEIWNAKEERKASLKEIVSYLIKQWKTHKQTNKRKRKVISIWVAHILWHVSREVARIPKRD